MPAPYRGGYSNTNFSFSPKPNRQAAKRRGRRFRQPRRFQNALKYDLSCQFQRQFDFLVVPLSGGQESQAGVQSQSR